MSLDSPLMIGVDDVLLPVLTDRPVGVAVGLTARPADLRNTLVHTEGASLVELSQSNHLVVLELLNFLLGLVWRFHQ
jgi:hypothetical protein